MQKKFRIFVFSFLAFVLIFSLGSYKPVQAAAISDPGYNICGGAGWSPLLYMNLAPGQTRTIYFSPMRAGHDQFVFYSSPGTIIKLVPYWSGNTGSGTWGPYYSIYGSVQTLKLETGNASIKYQFKVSETRGKWATIYFKNYCSATY